MTFGRSRTVEAFLIEVGMKRNFQVLVAESAPTYSGRETAEVLSKEQGIDVTLISDAAVYAMMARVNKVIIGTHTVMANGGLLAQSGTHIVAQAAKAHSVPVIVCTALYKLCPRYPSGRNQELLSPEIVLPSESIENISNVTVLNPSWDYIPPELVSLYITNVGAHNPTYLYRVLSEFYNQKDDY
eukprot:TRINITY_DN1542_c0_g1_i2.p2 TRINITY_DN1542_c0_g1~~TRINITY_DN1542_c0_g1_i2.p2  ORF type:complete len:185 (+),score=24.40 TRINITY_DN1542_c0_g1_i2:701-1255(+)